MDVEEGLLAAITAHPTEDTPRLVYADWLEENGQPVRAEFIRVQCAVKHLEELPAEKQRPHVHLWRRNQELLDHHRRDLLGPLGDDLTYFDAVFDRGFLTQLTVSLPLFLKHAAAIRALRPLPRIRVNGAGGVQFRVLHECPDLAVVETLNVSPSSDEEPPGQGLAFALAHSPHLTRLEVLEMEGCDIADEGLLLVAQSQALPALIELDVSRNDVTVQGVEWLIASRLWPRLRRVVLGGNPLGDEAAEVLADAADASRLENLNLRFTGIGPFGHRLLLNKYGGRVDLF
ncbi:MAG: TIGR02996 domain-containing protein [Gemmataceae bacterium]|nr:TIGR02996 domain-containing protein [Gemmataceae bacterium]